MSEVANLIEQIRREDEAMRQGLYAYAEGRSRHHFISTAYRNLEAIAVALEKHMPHDQAWTHIAEQLSES